MASGIWRPAAGTFPTWPERLADLKMLDPCCGSGHFLVAALLMLAPMRMELEGLSAREAVDAVLRDNLHGLELDRRCVELAAFALALAAWTYPGAGGYRPLPELNLACCGLSVRAAREEWQQLGLGKKNLALALAWLHETFQNAPALGSLLDPAGTDAAKLAQWGGEELSGALEQALAQEPDPDPEQRELAVAAKGLATAARLLGRRYHWVVTNVPYLARGKQGDILRDFCEKRYPAAKNDLATVFLERCLNLCEERGAACVVLPQNWLFLSSYKKFREQLLKRHTWRLVARLGPGAFEMISGEVVKAILLVISRGVEAASCHLTPPAPLSMNGEGGERGVSPSPFMERGPGGEVSGLDVSECRTAADKAERLLTEEIRRVGQAKQLENPDAMIALGKVDETKILSNYATSRQGISPADTSRYGRRFWEISNFLKEWFFWHGTARNTSYFSGMNSILWYNDDLKQAISNGNAYLRGEAAFGKKGIAVSPTGIIFCSLYHGNYFDDNVQIIIPHNSDYLPSIWSYCSSSQYNSNVKTIDQSLKVRNALVKVPFDLARWQKVAAEQYPHGLPQPYSDDPTQWIFHGHPCGSVIWNEQTKRLEVASTLRMDDTVLQVAVARLLGYRWPAELDEGMELAEEQRGWTRRSAELNGFADQDGIVCIPPVRGEPAAADRLLDLLAAAYGEAWNSDTLSALLTAADHAGKSLETWLRDKFFAQHCKLFQNRPFIWHIWDGLRDGFSVLVNYHRLDHKNLETLIYTYLGDWIARQKQDIAAGQDGAQERLAAAESLQKRLALILEGEAPHDIFVRWKPLDQQPIGWAPDLNDGVRLNIRPFMTAPDVKKRGAGVLRDKPNIKWDKDRGKDVASAPWFPVFHGDRINDHHLTLAEKRAARGISTS